MPLWQARNIVPDEEIPFGYETTIRWPLASTDCAIGRRCSRPVNFTGTASVLKFFMTYGTSVVRPTWTGPRWPTSPSLSTKSLNYNAIAGALGLRIGGRSRHTFDRHDFSFKWSYAEMAPTDPGPWLRLGYRADWQGSRRVDRAPRPILRRQTSIHRIHAPSRQSGSPALQPMRSRSKTPPLIAS